MSARRKTLTSEIEWHGDPRLEPLVGALDEETWRAEVERLLVSVARPLIRRILSNLRRSDRLLQPDDALDIEASVTLRLLGKLDAVSRAPEDALYDFASYVATLTYNVSHDFLRRRFPERTRLKNRIRYVVTHDARLSSWATDSGLACGLRGWSATATPSTTVELRPDDATPAMLKARDPAAAVVALLERVSLPVTLDALVTWAAELWGVRDTTAIQKDMPADPRQSPALFIERREFLRALWSEIQQLRPLQRRALLLNLRDGESVNVLALFVLTGTTTFDELAKATSLSPEELAAVWNDLPLDDRSIATSMNLTRQQVINLRKSARERLARRLTGWKGGSND